MSLWLRIPNCGKKTLVSKAEGRLRDSPKPGGEETRSKLSEGARNESPTAGPFLAQRCTVKHLFRLHFILTPVANESNKIHWFAQPGASVMKRKLRNTARDRDLRSKFYFS